MVKKNKKEKIDEVVSDEEIKKEDVKEDFAKKKDVKKEIVSEDSSSSGSEEGKTNYWIISTIALGILSLVLIVLLMRGGITGNVVSSDVAGNSLVDFLNQQTGGGVTLEGVKEENGLYSVDIGYMGETFNFYVSRDGESFVQGPFVPISGFAVQAETQPNQQAQQQAQQQTQQVYSQEDLEEISIFVDCLAEKGLKIYGANWCGWTKRLTIDTFGGFDIVAPIYVECTENDVLCREKNIMGYPTIKINDEDYQGTRTFESMAQATGCSEPNIGIQVVVSNTEASC